LSFIVIARTGENGSAKIVESETQEGKAERAIRSIAGDESDLKKDIDHLPKKKDGDVISLAELRQRREREEEWMERQVAIEKA
jgi:hypothetical protein